MAKPPAKPKTAKISYRVRDNDSGHRGETKSQCRSEKSQDNASSRREVKYHGLSACLEITRMRPDDVIRIYVTEERLGVFSDALRMLAQARKAYHVVTNEDLERLTESMHHQGVCVLANARKSYSFLHLRDLLREDFSRRLIVYLDGVENPHNFGAILRTCAHFGINYVLGAEGELPTLSPSACRVAEGGAEHVQVITLKYPHRDLLELKKVGFTLIATAIKGESLYKSEIPKRSVLILGSEQSGISPEARKLADRLVTISGTGRVDSLNVSAAFAVLAAEFSKPSLIS